MDHALLYFLNSFVRVNDSLDLAIFFLTGNFGLFLILVLILYLFGEKHKRQGVERAFTTFFFATIAWIVARIIKFFYTAPRPFEVLEDIRNLFSVDTGTSFPSGHMTFFTALGVTLFFYHRKMGLAYILAAFIIGFARVTAGVHWPIDILGGFIVGASVSALLYSWIQKKTLREVWSEVLGR